MDAPHDQPMVEPSNAYEAGLSLSDGEEKVLALYDKLQELQLEIAIINAQNALPQAAPSEAEPAASGNELLEARARYLLRNRAVEAVLSANPILKAVHNGTNASPAERDLLGYVEQRDAAAISVAQLTSASAEVREQSARAQSDALRTSRRNVGLAAEVMALVAELDGKKSGLLGDVRFQHGLRELEAEVKASRQRWKVLKGLTSGIVVGSGINWADDDTLMNLVLDPENDE